MVMGLLELYIELVMYLEKARWLCFWLVIRDSRPSIVVLSMSLLDVVCLVDG